MWIEDQAHSKLMAETLTNAPDQPFRYVRLATWRLGHMQVATFGIRCAEVFRNQSRGTSVVAVPSLQRCI